MGLLDSARKLTSWVTSSPPKPVLGKRKAVSFDEDVASDPELHNNNNNSGYNDDDESDYSSDSSESEDERSAHEEVNCFSDDYKEELPSTKRIVRSAKVTHNRNDSLQNNRTLRKIEQDIHERYIEEQDIQQELGEKSRQEQVRTVKPQRKRAIPGTTKTTSVTRRVTFEPTASTSKPRTKPAVKFSPPKNSARTEAAPVPKSTTPKAQWADKPNTRAREILRDNLYSPAAILDDLQEPEYACRDIEIRDGVWKLMDQIEAFAKQHFSFKLTDKKRLRPALESLHKETVKIIGCVASGGPAGASGWEDLFIESDKRQALVCAIISNVIVEQIFQHMFFGGTEQQIKAVSGIQYTHRNHDAFVRNKLYAEKIRSFLSPSTKGKAAVGGTPSLHLPPNFNLHSTHITAPVLTHLKPILTLSHPTSAFQSVALRDLIRSLYPITILAGLLSLSMRLDGHTVYHFAPVFKEQAFSASSMACHKHRGIDTHPRGNGDEDGISSAEQERRSALPSDELARMQHDQGLAQITLFPGITAYRLGGWETPSSKPYEEHKKVKSEEGCEGVGVRVRPLTEAWVYCRWGRERAWKDERPADKAETHGVAWKGGFVEFYPGVPGVRDLERTQRMEAKRIEARREEENRRREEAVELGGSEDEDEDA